MGLKVRDEVDIKIVFFKYKEKYYTGELYFNDVNIHFTELQDIIQFPIEELENENKRIIEHPDYCIDILVEENAKIIEVDRAGRIEDPVKIFEFCEIKEKDKDFYRNFIKVKAKELATGLYATKYTDGISMRNIKINNKNINLIRDCTIMFFDPI